MNLFVQRFWTDIYDEYEDDFVTEYAIEGPEEDIAETFMKFVLVKRPKGKTVAEKKILFFYQFRELINMRKEMRDSLK